MTVIAACIQSPDMHLSTLSHVSSWLDTYQDKILFKMCIEMFSNLYKVTSFKQSLTFKLETHWNFVKRKGKNTFTFLSCF